MNASDYLNRSALYRKLVYGPYREFASEGLNLEGAGRLCAVHPPLATCRPSNIPATRRSRRFSMPVIGRRQWGIATMRF